MSHGASQWSSALSRTITSSVSYSYSSSPIKYYGGTAAEITATGVFTANSSLNGHTVTHYTVEGEWKKGSISYTGRLITSAEGYIIDKNHTTNQYKKTCTHELGHALGWNGHSSKTADIMYGSGSSVTSLTLRDKRHLNQIC